MSESRRFAKNTFWNLFAQAAPLAIAVVAVPVVLKALGVERFGVLLVAWTAIGYFNFFDFGLPRVLTLALSGALAEGDEVRLGVVSQLGLLAMLALGFAGGIVIALLTPWLIHSALNVPANLQREATTSFYLLAACMPFVVTTSGFRGILEAHQQFGMAALLRLPYAAFNYIAPLIAVTFSRSLVPVVVLLVVGRIVTWAAHLIVCVRTHRYLRTRVPLHRSELVKLLRLGGWMTASNIISPLMFNIDRFVIGGLLSMAAVTYYVTPFDLVTKLMLVPSAIIGVLFPALAARARDGNRANDLTARAIRMMAIIMFPATVVAIALAPEALRLWVGEEVSSNGARVAQWLALGVLVNSVAQIPFTLLHAEGRPDLTAKLHVIELPLYGLLLWYLTIERGVDGVALAWTARVVADTVMLLVVVAARSEEARRVLAPVFRVAIPLIVAASLPMFFHAASVRFAIAAATLVCAGPLIWKFGLDEGERARVRQLLRRPLFRERAAT
jgi:O-antigen/teichoic acid export membrane protein